MSLFPQCAFVLFCEGGPKQKEDMQNNTVPPIFNIFSWQIHYKRLYLTTKSRCKTETGPLKIHKAWKAGGKTWHCSIIAVLLFSANITPYKSPLAKTHRNHWLSSQEIYKKNGWAFLIVQIIADLLLILQAQKPSKSYRCNRMSHDFLACAA